MPVKSPAVTFYIPSYLPLVFDLPYFISKCSFSYSSVVLVSTLVSSCASGDFLFIQVSSSAIISSLPVQQYDLPQGPSKLIAFCLVVWLLWGIFAWLFVFDLCTHFSSEMDSQRIQNPLSVQLPWMP